MKLFRFICSTNTIWASFDGGLVIAETSQEGLKLAKKYLTNEITKVKLALEHCDNTKGITIDMDVDACEIDYAEKQHSDFKMGELPKGYYGATAFEDWTATELFDFLVEMGEIDSDEEFDDYVDSRGDMINDAENANEEAQRIWNESINSQIDDEDEN